MMLSEQDRDAFYTHCAQAINQAGRSRESLLLARAVLLMAEEVGDLNICKAAVDAALKQLPEPSLAP
jgi:Protein of unknown function (DUF2783)